MLKKLLKSFYHRYYRFKKFKVLGRTACLGNEIIKQLGWNKNYINHQKSRVDYLLELNENSSIVPNSSEIFHYLKHKFIIGTIEQQKNDFFKYKKPDIIVMDSFSELTDQLFVNISNNKKFLANYSDINHKLLPKNYQCFGLIEEGLYEYYDLFFTKIENIYPNTPLYFIHFSTILDTRQKFREREIAIKNAINKLSKKYKFIKIISLSDDEIEWANSGDVEYKKLPYHYSAQTYRLFTKEFKDKLMQTDDIDV